MGRSSVPKFVLGIVSKLVRLVYGDDLFLIKGQRESEEPDGNGRVPMFIGNRQIPSSEHFLHTILGMISIALVSLLAMVFADIFFVNSWPGCQPSLDCYVDDANFSEPPIENCSDPKYWNVATICYNLELDAQVAIGAVGGILVMARLAMVLFAKAILQCIACCVKYSDAYYEETDCCKCLLCLICCSCCTTSRPRACQLKFYYSLQILFGLVLLSVYIGVVYLIFHAERNKPRTALRTTGYIIQYTAVGGSVLLTILVPWHRLLQ